MIKEDTGPVKYPKGKTISEFFTHSQATFEMDSYLFVSIIIPVHNAAQHLDKCLTSIATSPYPSYEIIVVDDGCTDDSAEIALKKGARVYKLPVQSGPAAARNYGSQQAKGDILFFIDSDVLIQQGTIVRVVNDFNENLDIAAVFGSYDDSPAEKNFFSQYKNLQHHFIHQHSSEEAVTFWAGCGAIRREVFQKVGGFDQASYLKPSIEDIELGYRMKKMGYRILLDKTLQVKHLKKWTFKSLLRADIFHRAIPWTKLILESHEMVSDLNLQVSQKVSTGLVGIMIGIVPLSFYKHEVIYLMLCLLASVLIINRELFYFFLRRRGLQFTVLAFVMYLLYYFYSGASYASYWLLYKVRN